MVLYPRCCNWKAVSLVCCRLQAVASGNFVGLSLLCGAIQMRLKRAVTIIIWWHISHSKVLTRTLYRWHWQSCLYLTMRIHKFMVSSVEMIIDKSGRFPTLGVLSLFWNIKSFDGIFKKKEKNPAYGNTRPSFTFEIQRYRF